MNTFTTRGKHVFTSEWKSLQVILKLIIRFVIRYLFHILQIEPLFDCAKYYVTRGIYVLFEFYYEKLSRVSVKNMCLTLLLTKIIVK